MENYSGGIFKSIWVQPAAGDAGGALGAALAAYYRHFKGAREVLASDSMQGALLGPYVRSAESSVVLRSPGAVFVEVGEPELSDRVAQDLAEGKVVGWVKGRTEFGPRALGNRSILADPSAPDMQRQLNLKVKFRESFRPFAPCVLAEYVSEWFEMEGTSPYMLFTAPIRGDKRIENPRHEVTTGINRLHEIRSRLSATTHVDFSSRIQTVDEERHPDLHRVLTAFHKITSLPALVNTSFNVRGELLSIPQKMLFIAS